MSTEMGGIKGPHEITFTRFYGGADKGACIQVTGYNCDERIGYVSFTKDEVRRAIKKFSRLLKELA